MDPHPHTTFFTQVDRSRDPDFFVRFMDEVQKAAGFQASKRVLLEAMALRPGQSALEVGCGPGSDLFDLADIVAPGGRLVGLDASEIMLAEARRRAEARGAAARFAQGDVEALPFGDGTFDACRAARLLVHLADPARAIAEMARVVRPGGRVVVYDFDWGSFIIDHPDKSTTQTFVSTYSDSLRNGWIGRQLPRLFKQQGLEVTAFVPLQVFVHYALAELAFGSHLALLQTNGTLSGAQAQTWWRYLQDADSQGAFFVSFTTFVIGGTRA